MGCDGKTKSTGNTGACNFPRLNERSLTRTVAIEAE